MNRWFVWFLLSLSPPSSSDGMVILPATKPPPPATTTTVGSRRYLNCTTNKFYANGVHYPIVETTIHGYTSYCQLEIEMAVICDVNTVSMTGSTHVGHVPGDRCSSGSKNNTIVCQCDSQSYCNGDPKAINEMLIANWANYVNQDHLDCAFEVLKQVFDYPPKSTTPAASTATAPLTTPPVKEKDKLSYEETFAGFKTKEKKKATYSRQYRDFDERYSLIYFYCFILLTLVVVGQMRRYVVDRYDLQEDLSLWFEKKKEDEMLWWERLRESTRDYRREYTRAGDEYWKRVKRRDKKAMVARIAEWKDRYERGGECQRVESDGVPKKKEYTPEAIEKRAHDWAEREERVTLLGQQADADAGAATLEKEKADEEDKRHRDELLKEIGQPVKPLVAVKRRRHQYIK